jgi:hypothetical protein
MTCLSRRRFSVKWNLASIPILEYSSSYEMRIWDTSLQSGMLELSYARTMSIQRSTLPFLICLSVTLIARGIREHR